jgi:hypothetical protein
MFRRSFQVEDRFYEGSCRNRRTSRCSLNNREISSHDVNGNRWPPLVPGGYAVQEDMFHLDGVAHAACRLAPVLLASTRSSTLK